MNKLERDLMTGIRRRELFISCAENEIERIGVRYIKFLSIKETEILATRTFKQKNTIQNRTLRETKDSTGLTLGVINLINNKTILIELRIESEPYLKATDGAKTIPESINLFGSRYFLKIEIDKEEIPKRFSRLVLIKSIPEKEFYFSDAVGNTNRIKVKNGSKYFVLRGLKEKTPKSFFKTYDENLNCFQQIIKLLS